MLYVNNVSVLTWDWTQGGTITDQLAGNDFFGAAATDEMYFDDYRFSDIPIPVELTSFTANVNTLGRSSTWKLLLKLTPAEIERRTEPEYKTIDFVVGYGTNTDKKLYLHRCNCRKWNQFLQTKTN
jgi:hypothetical protein